MQHLCNVISCSFCLRYKMIYNTHNWLLERGFFKGLNCAMPSMGAPKWNTVCPYAHINCTSYMSLGMYCASFWKTSTHRIITRSCFSRVVSPCHANWSSLHTGVHYIRLNLLQACVTASWATTHLLSNYSGQFQHLGNWLNNDDFNQ